MALGPSTHTGSIVDGLVAEIWDDAELVTQTIKDDPILGMSQKVTSFSEAIFHHPIAYGAPMGVQRRFEDSKRLMSAVHAQSFQLKTKELYQTFSIDGKQMRAAEAKGTKQKIRAYLIDPIELNGTEALKQVKRVLSQGVHGNGVGAIGQIAAGSDVTTATITLADANDLKNFRANLTLGAEASGATGGTAFTGEALVLKIGTPDNPTVTLVGGQTFASVFGPTLATGHFLYAANTYDDFYIYGMESFNPFHTGSVGTAPISDFLGCARSFDPNWFGGFCMDGTKKSFLQRVLDSAQILHDNEREPSVYLCSTRNFAKAQMEATNKLVLTKAPAASMGGIKFGVEYNAYEVQGPAGPIKVLPSPWMKDNVERCGDMDTLVMGSIGQLINWQKGAGKDSMQLQQDSDAWVARLVSDPVFYNKAPGNWCRIAC